MKRRSPARSQLGFTLVEVLIALVIVGILAAVAYPSFSDAVRKSRRSEAMTALSAIQLAQERYRNNEPSYASDLVDDLKLAQTTESGLYTLEVSGTATGYTAVATPAAGSSQLKDGECAQLAVEMDNGKLRYGSAAAEGTLDYSNTNRCWAK